MSAIWIKRRSPDSKPPAVRKGELEVRGKRGLQSKTGQVREIRSAQVPLIGCKGLKDSNS